MIFESRLQFSSYIHVPNDVAQHVCVAFDDFVERTLRGQTPNNWDGLRDDLRAWISGVETDIAFDGLFQVLETQTRYKYQWLAGDFIVRVTTHFNASADTIPGYLTAIFGDQVVLDTLRELRESLSDLRLIAAIESMRYWLGGA